MNKRDIFIGSALIALGVFLAAAYIATGSMGIAGRILETHIFPHTGGATIFLGILSVWAGMLLLASKRPVPAVIGVVLLSYPVMLTVALFSPSQIGATPDLSTTVSAFVGRYVGGFGKWASAAVVLVVALRLIAPTLLFRALVGLWSFTQKKRAMQTKKRKSQSQTTQVEEMGRRQSDTSNSKAERPLPEELAERKPEGELVTYLDSQNQGSTRPDGSQAPIANDGGRLNTRPLFGFYEKVAIGHFLNGDRIETAEPDSSRPGTIVEAFAAFDIAVTIGDVAVGPSCEQYEIIPGTGVKISKIKSVVEDVGVRLKCSVTLSRRATDEALVLELPASRRVNVPYGFLLESTFDDGFSLPVALGVDAFFTPHSLDLAATPHLLIAGTTGSGKSVLLRGLISSLIYHKTPNEVRFVLVDPKRVEFGVFAEMRYLAYPVVTSVEKAGEAFDELATEMERRYEAFQKIGCSDIAGYLKTGEEMPYIVVVVDEFADLFLSADKSIKTNCIRLAQKARASGIHLVLGTQRPSADIVEGLLKTNIPGRIALTVASGVDSRIILDRTGAENLTGKGDMICLTPEYRSGIRLQGAYLDDNTITRLIERKSTSIHFSSYEEVLNYVYGRATRPITTVAGIPLVFPPHENAACPLERASSKSLQRLNEGKINAIDTLLEAMNSLSGPESGWAIIDILRPDKHICYTGLVACSDLGQLESIPLKDSESATVGSTVHEEPGTCVEIKHIISHYEIARNRFEEHMREVMPRTKVDTIRKELSHQ